VLITEKRLRNIVKEILNETSLGGSKSSDNTPLPQQAQAKEWIDKTNPAYKYYYEPITDVMMILSSPNSKKPVIVDKTKQSKAYNAILVQFNSLSQAVATSPSPVANMQTGKAGFVVFGKQDYFPLDAAVRGDNKVSKPGWISKLIDQGHGFAIVVKGSGAAVRYDFGRYKEAETCPDPRLSAQLFAALGLKAFANTSGITTMGIVHTQRCSVNATFSSNKKEILNLGKFLAGTKKSDDSATQYVVVPVADADAASAYAQSKVGKCTPYAIPGFAVLQTGATNCGSFAYQTIQAGSPTPPFNAEIRSLLDTPMNLYQELAGSGVYKTT